MLFTNKNAVIYGAGGSLGSAVALALAKEGAKVFLTGHRLTSVAVTEKKIIAEGGKAISAEVDALNEKQVNDHLASLTKTNEKIHVVFNAIGWQDRQNIPLTEMSREDFVRPIELSMRTQFITSTAAARVMITQKSGVILSLTATPGGIGYPLAGGFGPACCAVESLCRGLASEVGVHGVRVINIRSAGSPDSRPFREALARGGEEVDGFMIKLKNDTMLKELPMMQDIANVAVFLASDLASKITGVTVDVTAGTTAALNYSLPNIPFYEED